MLVMLLTPFSSYSIRNVRLSLVLYINSLKVCFSPEGQCESLIVSQIRTAKSSLYVQFYSFTSKNIVKALVEAKERVVMVKVLTDKSQITEKYSQIPWLKKQGIPIFMDHVNRYCSQ